MDNRYFQREWTRPYPIPPEGVNLGLLEVANFACPGGALYPREVATYAALVWCCEGRVTFHCETRDLEIGAGQVGVLVPGTRYCTSCTGKRTEFWYLALDGKASRKLVDSLGLWEGVFPYLNIPYRWLDYLGSQIDNLERQKTIAGLGQSMFETVRHDFDIVMRDKLVWRAELALHENWQNRNYNVDALLKELQCTRSTLTPRFKKRTGTTPQKYLSDIRYREALQLLRSSDMRCHEIAGHCGFSDSAYFSRWFRSRHGVSPMALRR